MEDIKCNQQHIFVADRGNKKIQIFKLDGGSFVRAIPCDLPSALCIFDDLIYVVVSFGVCIFNFSGKQVTTFGIEDMAKGIAVTKDEIFISLDDQNKIIVYSHDGKKLREFGKKGTEPARFDRPYQITLFNDKLFICDSWNNRIQIFDKWGNFLETFGHAGDRNGEFKLPRGIFIRHNLIYIADSGNNRVQIFNLDGQFLHKFGVYPDFSSPHSLVVDHSNRLYVADTGNNRIKVYGW